VLALRNGILLTGIFLVAQAQDSGEAAFDVASIKASGPKSQRNEDGGPGTQTPGRYLYHGATLLDLIAMAYHVDYFQVSSRVDIDQKYFDLDAKVSLGATREQFREMLRRLLRERFDLRAHVEFREYAGYELRIAKSGLKLKEGVPAGPSGDGFPEVSPGRPGMASTHSASGSSSLVRMRAQQQSMAAFAGGLNLPDRRPVIDKTGVPGLFDFTLEYSLPRPGAEALEPSAVPELFAALQQQLGLQLVGAKIPFRTVVVESVRQTPTEN
jgi:uncharacterized protein (TIGR03435 family)